MLCSLGASWALLPMEIVNAQATNNAKINFFMKVSFRERTAGDGITDSRSAIKINNTALNVDCRRNAPKLKHEISRIAPVKVFDWGQSVRAQGPDSRDRRKA